MGCALCISLVSTCTYAFVKHYKESIKTPVVNTGREIQEVDGEVSSGKLPLESPEKLKERLQKKVDESMLSIKINANPIFVSPDSDGTLAIENSINNRYKFQVEITLDDSDEKIYTSPVIQPGEYIMNDKLDVILDNGIYNATARFYAYNDSDEFIGQAGAGLKIQIGK